MIAALAALAAGLPQSTPPAKAREVLLAARGDGAPTPEISKDRLVQAGPALIPALFESLETGLLPAGPPEVELDPVQEEIAVGALVRFRRPVLAKPLGHLLDVARRPAARADGIQILAEVGDASDLKTLCRVLRGGSPEDDPDPGESRLFRGAVAAILARDPVAFSAARELLHTEPASVRFHLVGALADLRSSPALEVLSSQLGGRPEEDLLLLSEISRAAAATDLPVDERVAPSVRVCLHRSDPNEVRTAAEVLGRMEDEDSIGELLPLLRCEDRDVARAAHAALCAITGADLLPDPARWRAWLDAESAWFGKIAPALAAELETADRLRKAAVIGEMAAHPLHRREIAGILGRALRSDSPDLLRVGCAALRQLGAQTAVPFLEECAARAEPEPAAAAREALAALRARRKGPVPLPGAPQEALRTDR
jgi:HEAT repeat protein